MNTLRTVVAEMLTLTQAVAELPAVPALAALS